MIRAVRASLDQILPLRNLFLKENNFQIRYNACHERSWADEYLLLQDNKEAGYGSVKGKRELTDRDSIFEFYLISDYRANAAHFFEQLINVSKAAFIETQSNEPVLTSLQASFARNIKPEAVLFGNAIPASLVAEGFEFRPRREEDSIFQHHLEPIGTHVLDHHGEVVATGGYMTHYNKPHVDLYVEVNEPWRRRGLASYLLQKIRETCSRQGFIPCARCGMENPASRSALRKAGFQEVGLVLSGEIIHR